MPSWWIDPVIPPERWWQFAAVVLVLTLVTVIFSPHRRRAMGAFKLAAAHGSLIAGPLAGVIVIRSGFRHAYVADGRTWWDALWLSLPWMIGFIVAAQLLVTRIPPTSWLIRDMRKVGKDMWIGRLKRWFGVKKP